MTRYLASLVLCAQVTAAPAAEYTAVLDWSQRAVLSTPVSGVIDSVSVAAGDRVEAGQRLLQLDQRPFESTLRDARAQLRKRRLQRDEAGRELARTRELYERRVISSHDLQVEEISFAAAKSDYASAAAVVDAAKLELEYSTLDAPFAGIVLAVDVTAGMTVINAHQATPLVTLAQDRPMHALAQMAAETLADLVTGKAVTVNVRGKSFSGEIRHIGAEAGSNGQYTLTVSFDPGENTLQAGLPVRIEVNH
ncbi:MAG: efflux RND transporter periplasmic adaptor subunit [Gammaproteobacteria bacterium]|jgi:RND family efflux transporter MFP subunit